MHWLPPQTLNHYGQARRVGVELEFAGLDGKEIAKSIAATLGGDVDFETCFEAQVTNTRLGDFTIELDASYFKEFARAEARTNKQLNDNDSNKNFFENIAEILSNPNTFSSEKSSDVFHPLNLLPQDIVTKAAEWFVPWEIVSPPITIADLSQLAPLITDLQSKGALGTRHTARFAFGVHLNPELPQLDVGTILRYLRAYFCLYDWLYEIEKVDLTRKLTPYIKHFDKKYIQLVVSQTYKPNLTTLIDDYLHYNPTRNRSLDMLPLFRHLDEAKVTSVINDSRIKARPTLHYRLPNCDIDNPQWNIDKTWQNWLKVEALADNDQLLATLCSEFELDLKRITHPLDSKWLNRLQKQFGDTLNMVK